MDTQKKQQSMTKQNIYYKINIIILIDAKNKTRKNYSHKANKH